MAWTPALLLSGFQMQGLILVATLTNLMNYALVFGLESYEGKLNVRPIGALIDL
jgi:hypothetical protein